MIYGSYDDYNYYDESSSDDSIWVQTESDSRADNSSDNPWDSSEEETAAVHHTGSTSASLGGSCAPGCIWSSYAVQMGLNLQKRLVVLHHVLVLLKEIFGLHVQLQPPPQITHLQVTLHLSQVTQIHLQPVIPITMLLSVIS